MERQVTHYPEDFIMTPESPVPPADYDGVPVHVHMTAEEELTPSRPASPMTPLPASMNGHAQEEGDGLALVTDLEGWKKEAMTAVDEAQLKNGDELTDGEKAAVSVHKFSGAAFVDQLYQLDMVTSTDPSPLRTAVDRGKMAVGRYLSAGAILIESIHVINKLL